MRAPKVCNAQVDLPDDPNLPGSGAAPAKHVFASAPALGRSSGDHPSPRGRISDGVGRKASTNSDGGGARAASEQGEAGAWPSGGFWVHAQGRACSGGGCMPQHARSCRQARRDCHAWTIPSSQNQQQRSNQQGFCGARLVRSSQAYEGSSW